MKRLIKIVISLSAVFAIHFAEAKTITQAIVQVESCGKVNAIGDNGKAKGAFQIWNVVIKDVNRIYKTNYTHNDAFDIVKAEDIFIKYTSYWAKFYQKKTGKAITNEVIARIWNGGPFWFKAPSKTNYYWSKVKKQLQS